MSSHKENFVIDNDSENVKQSCRYALNVMQLMVKEEKGNKFIANEKFSYGFSNAAKIEVSIVPQDNSTTLKLKVSNMGFGPIQGKHCRTVANTFINAVKFKSKENSSTETNKSNSDELKKFAELKDPKIIKEEEFQEQMKDFNKIWSFGLGEGFYKFKRWEVIFLIIFLPFGIYLYSAGEGTTYSLKTNKGGTIKFKKENVSCERIPYSVTTEDISLSFGKGKFESSNKPPKKTAQYISIRCRASGVRTDIAGYKFAYSSEQLCSLEKDEYIPCIVGEYFKKYDRNDKTIISGSFLRYIDEK